jgi:acetyltransferase-like isoleucine patch superfamily enzyme
VHIGAIVTVPSGIRLSRGNGESNLVAWQSNAVLNTMPIGRWDVLGKSILDRVLERLRAFGVGEISVIPEQSIDSTTELAHSASSFWIGWDAVISRYLQFELGTLLLVGVGPYVELDLADFLRFHREASSPMTQVYDRHGALDWVAVDAKRLAQGTDSFRSRLQRLIPRHRRYSFRGYSNRLSEAGDFRRLVKDALWGRAGIRPIGKEISANVWVGEDAWIEQSARVLGPAYIGTNCRVNGGCTISGACAIEQQSEIDCGTTVDDSSVLAGSYVGAGLKVCSGVVYQEIFFHLRRNVQLQFRDRKLFGKRFTAGGLLRRSRVAAAVPYPQTVVQ